jgi:hypothetical protein
LLVAILTGTSLIACGGNDNGSNDFAAGGAATSAGANAKGGAPTAGNTHSANAGTGHSTEAGATNTTDGGTSNADAGLWSLDTCPTDIADGTPAFFSKYFKCVTITHTKADVRLASRNLPPHKSNYWGTGSPNYVAFDTSRGPEYKANPNTLLEKAYAITIPKAPVAKGLTITADMIDGVVRTSDEEYPMSIAGVALDSVTLFNPLAAAGHDIEEEAYTFDNYNAHPDAMRLYHYHTASPGPLEVLAAIGAPAAVELFGMMCDGTVVLGCTELDGKDADLTKLDAQGGHVADITDEEGTTHFAARYHTHVCPTKPLGHPFTPEIQYYEACGI